MIGSPPPSQAVPDGVTTIIASTDPAARPGSGVCVVSDEDVPRAYAIIAGLALPEVSTAQFLIDGDGWLRSLQRPGVAPGWNDPAVLAQAVAAIRAHPLSSMGAGSAPMRM